MQNERKTLAAVLIVKNEGGHLASCLKTVADWVDEIVVVDAGSSDDTVAIARSFQARVFVNDEWPGFGKQRQLAQRHVQSEWILWLDADERVTPALRGEIESILSDPPGGRTLYAVPRLSWAFGRFIRHSGWYPDYVVRMYAAGQAEYDGSIVHEKVLVPPGATVKRLKGNLLHYPYRDIQHYVSKVSGYTALWARQQHERGKKATPLTGMGHAIACFLRMYVFRAGILDGAQGFILATLGAYTTFIKYCELWAMNQRNEIPK